jgi:hypothetical protein
MEYLSNQSSFKITHRRGMRLVDPIWLCLRRLGQQFIPQVDVRNGYAVQQVADHVEAEDAEDDGALYCGG